MQNPKAGAQPLLETRIFCSQTGIAKKVGYKPHSLAEP